MKGWTFLWLGVLAAVIAAVLIEWLNRVFNAPTGTANDSAWKCVLSGGAGSATGCSLPNYNLRPENPATVYQSGAPVTNFRPVKRVGVLEISACDYPKIPVLYA